MRSSATRSVFARSGGADDGVEMLVWPQERSSGMGVWGLRLAASSGFA